MIMFLTKLTKFFNQFIERPRELNIGENENLNAKTPTVILDN